MTEAEQLLANLETQTAQTGSMSDLVEDELSLLKDRAKLMGIKFSNNIGIESLREKIATKQAGEEMPDETATKVNPLAVVGAPEEMPEVKKMTLREHMVKEQMRLVRLRIQNLDPKKKDLHGEVLCIANEYLGTVKKFVPFGEVTDEGYHVPFCIFTEMEARRFQNIRTFTDKATGQIRIESSWVREFSLEVLPPLTKTELIQLASAQAAAGNK